jgi:flagellar motility protein MotE (MotC chaperone)
MVRIVKSPATVLAAAFVSFFLTLFLALHAIPLGEVAAVAAAREPRGADDNPSWRFHNPDIDQWVAQLKTEKDALGVREQQLKDWEARLTAESREIAAVTQAVTHTQEAFDKRVVLFNDLEKDNAKKQLKVIADMTPDGAVAMMNEMPDDEVVRLLYSLKPDISGSILDAMSKLGQVPAKRAALLAEKIKEVLPVPATNTPAANAAR